MLGVNPVYGVHVYDHHKKQVRYEETKVNIRESSVKLYLYILNSKLQTQCRSAYVLSIHFVLDAVE